MKHAYVIKKLYVYVCFTLNFRCSQGNFTVISIVRMPQQNIPLL